MRRALHRLLTGSAAALLAAAVVAAPGTPALAADPGLRVYFPDVAVAGKDPKISMVYAWVDVPGTKPSTARKLAVSIDTADVADIATVSSYDEYDEYGEEGGDDLCDQAGTVITCEIDDEILLDPGMNLLGLAALSVTAKPGAAVGAEGKLAITARLDDGPAVASESKVTIGEGVDLAGVIGKPVVVPPGGSAAADLRVANTGTVPVKGVVMAMESWDPGMTEGETFSNCTYGFITICTFADELATGTTYELSKPMRVKLPADAASGSRTSVFGGWYTPSDFKELLDLGFDLDDEIIGKKGTGGPVSLRAVSARKKSLTVDQVDTDPDNNILVNEFVVGGNRRPDMAAIGATITGAAGDKVRTKVGYVNNGPGVLYHRFFENVDPLTHVFVPAGVEAVEVDGHCLPLAFDGPFPEDMDEKNFAGATEYLCFTGAEKTEAGSKNLFDFTFEVRDDASDKPGKILINEDLFGDDTILDQDDSNNAAKIAVELSGGSGGGLPVTGANAGLVGAAGAALLLAGLLGVMLVRRRRVRFTA